MTGEVDNLKKLVKVAGKRKGKTTQKEFSLTQTGAPLKCDKCGAVINAKVEANLEARKLPPKTGESTKQEDHRRSWNKSIDDIKRIAKAEINMASKTSQSDVANGDAARKVASCPKCGNPRHEGKAKPV
jgi:predicted RNA-binding Zn-ribbon protein involved in translation (DUF1610 family)